MRFQDTNVRKVGGSSPGARDGWKQYSRRSPAILLKLKEKKRGGGEERRGEEEKSAFPSSSFFFPSERDS